MLWHFVPNNSNPFLEKTMRRQNVHPPTSLAKKKADNIAQARAHYSAGMFTRSAQL